VTGKVFNNRELDTFEARLAEKAEHYGEMLAAIKRATLLLKPGESFSKELLSRA